MARMHLLMNALMEGDDEPITETMVFEGDPEFIARQLADWLEEQARQVRAGLADDEAAEARGD